MPSSRSPLPVIIAGVIGGLVLIVVIGTLAVWQYKRKTSVAPAAAPVTSARSVSTRSEQVDDKILRNEGLDDSDVSGLSLNELRILSNLHFARYGRKYERPGLGDYFSTRS